MSLHVRTTISAASRTKTKRLIKGVTRAMETTAREVLEEITDNVIDRMKVYPPKLIGQKYKRTGRLKRSWKKKKMPGGFQIVNLAARKGRKYSGYVVGDSLGKGQAKIHQDRWKNFYEMLESYMKYLRFRFDDKVKTYLGKMNIKPYSGVIKVKRKKR